MLEIRKNTFVKNYENIFFREMARDLYKAFKERNYQGVLIGSPVCAVDERLQIDALLITPNVICIIDFKNIMGKVTLPSEEKFETGLWTREDGGPVKGGSFSNPFRQLKWQKGKFINVFERHIEGNIIKGDSCNPFHVVRIVCFQEKIELDGKIPRKDEGNFFIIDKENYLERILDIIDISDPEVELGVKSFDVFKSIFRADSYNFDEKVFADSLKEISCKSTAQSYKLLHDDQKEALVAIKSFIKDPDQSVFVLRGATNSGKSFLIPHIEDLVFNSDVQEALLFAASSRVANNLSSLSGSEIKVNSIYSYIYGGTRDSVEIKSGDEEDDVEIDASALDASHLSPLDVVPLKKCDNSEDALFIVDEAQLVSDSYYESNDLLFGTGYLLKDFLTFAEIKNKKRKIIFIGDSYQLHNGKTSQSPLEPEYLESAYGIRTSCYQLSHKDDYSLINKEITKCISGLNSQSFDALHFTENDNFYFIEKNEMQEKISSFIQEKTDWRVLCFGREDAQGVNEWIKESIIKNGKDIKNGDLVLFNNNISVEDANDPFAEPKKIYNGQFAEVVSVAENLFSESAVDKLPPLKFQEFTLKLKDSHQEVVVLSLENYRLSQKGELLSDERVHLKIILESILRNFMKDSPFEKSSEYCLAIDSSDYKTLGNEIRILEKQQKSGEKVKTKLEKVISGQKKLLKNAKKEFKNKVRFSLQKDPSSRYYQLKNAAFLRFGWAMTVHKSMSNKWKNIFFDVSPGGNVGRNNEQHFRWLYSGISRARQNSFLINYDPIVSSKKIKYYAYFINGANGVVEGWDACKKIVSGVSGAKYKGFNTQEEAGKWLASGADYNIKHIGIEAGIYFDSGTGGGNGVQVSVTDEMGRNLLNKVLSDNQINDQGKHLVAEGVTNNFGELLACKFALQLALKEGSKKIYGDSNLVIDYWSKGQIKIKEANTITLAKEVGNLRMDFERNGGEIKHISGSSNPADLGFHRD